MAHVRLRPAGQTAGRALGKNCMWLPSLASFPSSRPTHDEETHHLQQFAEMQGNMLRRPPVAEHQSHLQTQLVVATGRAEISEDFLPLPPDQVKLLINCTHPGSRYFTTAKFTSDRHIAPMAAVTSFQQTGHPNYLADCDH